MRVEILNLRRLKASLLQRLHDRAARAVAVFGPRRHVIGIRTGAVADELGDWLGAACERMLQFFDHEKTCAFAHHEPIARLVERTRCALRRVVEPGRERTGRRKATECGALDAGFRAACQCDVGFARTDDPRGIADRLHARRTGGDRRTERALEAVLDRHLTGGEIDEEGRDGERRQPPHAA